MSQHKLTAENINLLLLKMSTPAVIAMLATALFSLVDTIFLGQYVGKSGITACTVVLPLNITSFSFAIMIAVGASSIFSHAVGDKDYKRANLIAGNAFCLSLILGVVMTAIGYIFADPLLYLMGATKTVLHDSRTYLYWMLPGTIIFPLCIVGNNILRAEGNTKDSMIGVVSGVLSNIFLDWLFIVVFKWGIAGAAIATTLSKVITLVYQLYYYHSKQTLISVDLKMWIVEKKIFLRIVALGASVFFMNIAGSFNLSVINNILRYYTNEDNIAVYGIISKAFLFAVLPIIGIAQGLQPIVGVNFGAKEYKRILIAIRDSMVWGISVGIVALSLIYIFAEPFSLTMLKDKHLLDSCIDGMKILCLGVPFAALHIILTTVYQALGNAKPALYFSIFRQVGLFLTFVLLFPLIIKTYNLNIPIENSVWFSIALSDIVAAIVAVFFFFKIKKYILNKEHVKISEMNDYVQPNSQFDSIV
ncbi:MATE family efflux transporter [Lentisphaerota bacterium WC36G]|nr:MATE family efflux transporter [Lentisphaerae bacterium WC36]